MSHDPPRSHLWCFGSRRYKYMCGLHVYINLYIDTTTFKPTLTFKIKINLNEKKALNFSINVGKIMKIIK